MSGWDSFLSIFRDDEKAKENKSIEQYQDIHMTPESRLATSSKKVNVKRRLTKSELAWKNDFDEVSTPLALVWCIGTILDIQVGINLCWQSLSTFPTTTSLVAQWCELLVWKLSWVFISTRMVGRLVGLVSLCGRTSERACQHSYIQYLEMLASRHPNWNRLGPSSNINRRCHTGGRSHKSL